jgi:excisionase family DNA binding protein
MTEILFTTIEVAQMLYVDKSTVKRWTDEGKLKCFRTPGGHRKFRAEDLYAFVAQFNYGVTPMNLFPQFASDEAVIRQIITKKEYNVLASVCFSAAIKGKKDDVVKLFTEVHRYGLSLVIMFDELLRPTLKRIHDLSISGKLSAPEHQLAINALSTATLLMSDVIVKAAANGRKVICASIENESDDVMLKALTVLFESDGYEVLNLGAGVEAGNVQQLAKIQKPKLVCLLASYPVEQTVFADVQEQLIADLLPIGSALVLCGAGYASVDQHAAVCPTLSSLLALQHTVPMHTRVSGKKMVPTIIEKN